MTRQGNVRFTLSAMVAVALTRLGGAPLDGLPALSAPRPAIGFITPLDTAAVSGVESSIAVGSDGLGIISYHVGGSESLLRVAHCLSPACDAVTTTDIDTVGDVGWFSSIKIGSDGLAFISYVSYRSPTFQFTEDLKVAHSLNVACTAAKLSTIDTVNRDNGELGGLGMASIATASNGFGIVAYYDGGANNDLKVTVCGQADCSPGRWVHECIDRRGRRRWCPPTFEPLNTTTTVDNSPAGAFTGGWSSITVGRDGLALISYESNYTSTGSDLRVAHCLNVLCTAVTTTTADTGGFTGWYTSIAIGGDGRGVVAYYDVITKDLKVAHCADLVCSTASNTIVDAIDDVGRNPSVTIGRDGLPLISYLHLTRDDLRVAHCADAACMGGLVTPF